MQIIISPAKKMRIDMETFSCSSMPAFLNQTLQIMEWIQSLSFAEQKKLWGCNDSIAQENAERFARMDLYSHLTPSILAYDGIQYTSMGPSVFDDSQLEYVEHHLRILSGFYGLLRPLDGIVPYRLEMQAKAKVGETRNLYAFWGDLLYRSLLDESRIIINLASQEYAKSIQPYLSPEDRFITCVFGELEKGNIVQKGVYAKMARGDMVRYLAQVRAETPEALKSFQLSGYRFDPARSTATEFVFLRTAPPGKPPVRKS